MSKKICYLCKLRTNMKGMNASILLKIAQKTIDNVNRFEK